MLFVFFQDSILREDSEKLHVSANLRVEAIW